MNYQGQSSLTPNAVVEFFAFAEKLKTVYRHAMTSDNKRQESVAEHSWLVTLLAMMICPELTVKVDTLKLIKMLLVHDLGEAIMGDIPAFVKDKNAYAYLPSEREGLQQAINPLPIKLQSEIMQLFDEFENMMTDTAKVAKSLDRCEALMQHNLVPIETWDQGDFDMNPYYKNGDFDFDSFLRKLKDLIDIHTMKKIEDANKLDRIKQEFRKLWEDKQQLPKS